MFSHTIAEQMCDSFEVGHLDIACMMINKGGSTHLMEKHDQKANKDYW